jgi:predicted HicB family RNase H-like nuclease
VRISPDLHKKAVQKSLILGITLNKLVQKAIEKELES